MARSSRLQTSWARRQKLFSKMSAKDCGEYRQAFGMPDLVMPVTFPMSIKKIV
jgi:hypothetical protein